MFIQGTQSLTLAPLTDTILTIAGTIADEGGNGGTGAGSLVINGAGTVKLDAATNNTYSGGTTLDQGTLELASAHAAGGGSITFSASSPAILKIDLGDTPTNTIKGFLIGAGTIDLGGIAVSSITSAVIGAGNLLTVDYGSGSSLQLHLDTSVNYGTDQVAKADDLGGGTDLTMTPAGPIVYDAGATATFNGGGSPVVLDSGLTVTDTASTTLSSATVSIRPGFLSAATRSPSPTSLGSPGRTMRPPGY